MKTLILTFFLLVSIPIFSCDCRSMTTEEALKRSPVVFVGRLVYTSLDTNFFLPTGNGQQNLKYWTFEVIKYMKGMGQSCSKVSLISTGTNCDFNFDRRPAGSEFIIYADKVDDYPGLHLLTTNQCTQTKLTSEITDAFELQIFRDPQVWKTPDTSVQARTSKTNEIHPEKDHSNSNCLVLILLFFNIALTGYLIFRKN